MLNCQNTGYRMNKTLNFSKKSLSMINRPWFLYLSIIGASTIAKNLNNLYTFHVDDLQLIYGDFNEHLHAIRHLKRKEKGREFFNMVTCHERRNVIGCATILWDIFWFGERIMAGSGYVFHFGIWFWKKDSNFLIKMKSAPYWIFFKDKIFWELVELE